MYLIQILIRNLDTKIVERSKLGFTIGININITVGTLTSVVRRIGTSNFK